MALAVVGAIILASGRPVLGYAVMIPGGITGILFCVMSGLEGFLAREIAFFTINLFGVYSWLKIMRNKEKEFVE